MERRGQGNNRLDQCIHRSETCCIPTFSVCRFLETAVLREVWQAGTIRRGVKAKPASCFRAACDAVVCSYRGV
jgi:hypothetical protein